MMSETMKPTIYTVIFKDGTITKIEATGAIQAIILAQAGAILDGEFYEVGAVQNGDNGCMYDVEQPKLKATGGCR